MSSVVKTFILYSEKNEIVLLFVICDLGFVGANLLHKRICPSLSPSVTQVCSFFIWRKTKKKKFLVHLLRLQFLNVMSFSPEL